MTRWVGYKLTSMDHPNVNLLQTMHSATAVHLISPFIFNTNVMKSCNAINVRAVCFSNWWTDPTHLTTQAFTWYEIVTRWVGYKLTSMDHPNVNLLQTMRSATAVQLISPYIVNMNVMKSCNAINVRAVCCSNWWIDPTHLTTQAFTENSSKISVVNNLER